MSGFSFAPRGVHCVYNQLMSKIDQVWRTQNLAAWLLLPLSAVFWLLVALRRAAYRRRLMRSTRFGVPIVVVGNINVGGSGKTPLVIWLVRLLRDMGWQPGVVSRGYGGMSSAWPCRVDSGSDPLQVGDEPVVIAQRTGAPVVVDPDRVAAVRELLREDNVDVVISDDGLQHYALERDLEIVVVDGDRCFGNGFLLPAGPLREPVSRLRETDTVLLRGAGTCPCRVDGRFEVVPLRLRSVVRPQEVVDFAQFAQRPVHAVAGIAYPQRFFTTLSRLGMLPVMHSFPDHHRFVRDDLRFGDELPVIMTEKDAVKCRTFADENSWFLEVGLSADVTFEGMLRKRLETLGMVD